MILRDDIAQHRKFQLAGQLIGEPGGAARAFAVYCAAIGWARKFHTDGFIGHDFVTAYSLDSSVTLCVTSMSSRRVSLLHRVKDGYIIHDFEQYNGTSEKFKRQRELAAARKRKQRAKEAVERLWNPATKVTVTRDRVRDSRARAKGKGKGVRTTSVQPASVEAVEVPLEQRADALEPQPQNTRTAELAAEPAADGNYAVLVKLTQHVMVAEGITDTSSPDLIEVVKVAAARSHIRYDGEVLSRALRTAGQRGPLASMTDAIRHGLDTKTLPATMQAFAKRAADRHARRRP